MQHKSKMLSNLKKRLKNDSGNILIFGDTHEALIDRKTFKVLF